MMRLFQSYRSLQMPFKITYLTLQPLRHLDELLAELIAIAVSSRVTKANCLQINILYNLYFYLVISILQRASKGKQTMKIDLTPFRES